MKRHGKKVTQNKDLINVKIGIDKLLDVKRSSASPNHEATQESKALIEKVKEMIPEMEKENDITGKHWEWRK